ncbi:hypothetical protein AB0I28_02680 [Phytomonospora sp. NPDC050363]|uniref:hypothetical protein n=1 Tax=Phytomonospora sp. NPDC050363 TaxID=3155642 RepID=UPI0033DEAF6A
MRILNAIGDRLLARILPASKASAAAEPFCRFECRGAHGVSWCCFDAEGNFIGCTDTGEDC